MKQLLLLGLSLIFFASCQEQQTRYTQQSPEIDTVKQHIANYNAMDYSDMSHMADTSKSYLNSKKNFLSKSDLMDYHKANDSNYASRGFLKEDQTFEMVVTDDGETWVNCWLNWRGTMKESGKVIDIPVHLTYQFVDGKIVREVGMWDPTEVVLDLQAVAMARQEMETDEDISDSETDEM